MYLGRYSEIRSGILKGAEWDIQQRFHLETICLTLGEEKVRVSGKETVLGSGTGWALWLERALVLGLGTPWKAGEKALKWVLLWWDCETVAQWELLW